MFFLLLFFRLNIRKYSKVSEKWYSDEYGRVILHPRDEHLEIILLSSLNGGDCIILHLVTMTSYLLAPTLSTARKYIFEYRDTEQICLHHWHSHVAGTILFPVDNTCSGQSTCGIINVAEILRLDTWGQVLGSLDVKLWRYYEPAFFFSGLWTPRKHFFCPLWRLWFRTNSSPSLPCVADTMRASIIQLSTWRKCIVGYKYGHGVA